MKTETPKIMKFVNRKGKVVYLPANTTVEDLVKQGINISIVKPDKPLTSDDEYQAT